MKRSQQTCVLGGLLICGLGLGLPRVSYAVTGCTNGYLSGTYTASVQSANFLNVLNNINMAAAQGSGSTTSSGSTGSSSGSTGSAGSSGSSSSGSGSIAQQPGQGVGQSGSGSTGSTGSSSSGSGASTGSTSSSAASLGLVNNPFSLGGANPGTARYYFDGNGNIVGQDANATTSGATTAANTIVGTYSVNTDCTASITLNTGASFNAVVVSNGAQVLFMQSNAGQGGAVGALQRSTDVCLANSPTPQSLV